MLIISSLAPVSVYVALPSVVYLFSKFALNFRISYRIVPHTDFNFQRLHLSWLKINPSFLSVGNAAEYSGVI